MSVIFVLVKDYGSEGFTVHGVTEDVDAAQVWESADSSCRVITADTDASIDPSPMTFSERI